VRSIDECIAELASVVNCHESDRGSDPDARRAIAHLRAISNDLAEMKFYLDREQPPERAALLKFLTRVWPG